MTQPLVVRGGIVELDPVTGRTGRIVPLQYNPETITRTLAIQLAGEDKGLPLRLKGVAVETLKFDADVDAIDALGQSRPDATAVEVGIRPQLAALELLVQPRSDVLIQNRALAAAGSLSILPTEAPLALFVWSRARVSPVRVTELQIAEQLFDPKLNPIRARVTLGLRVLSVDDLGFGSVGGGISFAQLRVVEGLARRAPKGAVEVAGLP
jgi:hypothetical protein